MAEDTAGHFRGRYRRRYPSDKLGIRTKKAKTSSSPNFMTMSSNRCKKTMCVESQSVFTVVIYVVVVVVWHEFEIMCPDKNLEPPLRCKH